MRVCGIDPGLKGAITLMEAPARVLESHVMPILSGELDLHTLFELIDQMLTNHGSIDIAILERPTPIPINGVKGAFTSGKNYGLLRAALFVKGIAFTEVPPATIFQGLPKPTGKRSKDIKARNLAVVRKMFPMVDSKHDGIIDALLIAHYGLRVYLGSRV